MIKRIEEMISRSYFKTSVYKECQSSGECLPKILPYANIAGSVFFSSESTLKPGIFYFLGLNPGGFPDNNDKRQWVINNIFPEKRNNAFFDEKWTKNYDTGEAPLQKKIKGFLKELMSIDGVYQKVDCENFIRDICSSNLCFARSLAWSDKIGDAILFNVHEYVINEIIRPSVIIINGLAGYKIFRKFLGDKSPDGIIGKAGNSYIRYRVYDNDKILVGIPHLSRPFLKFRNPDNKDMTNSGLETKIKIWIDPCRSELIAKCKIIIHNRKRNGCVWSFKLCDDNF